MNLHGKKILITGGTGTLGTRLTVRMLELGARKVVIFSRDEQKQSEFQKILNRELGELSFRVRFQLGDVIDSERLAQAFHDIDVVIHAAALKIVAACEYNPVQCVNTNINGSINVVMEAIKAGVEKVVVVSTDKAVDPVNVYGASKCMAEKVSAAVARSFGSLRSKPFSCSIVRYGNVFGSRGSLFETLPNYERNSVFRLTDKRATRFFIHADKAVDNVLRAVHLGGNGDVLVFKMPSWNIGSVVSALRPDLRIQEVGLSAGEKVHESLISNHAPTDIILEYEDYYRILPAGSDTGSYLDSPGFVKQIPSGQVSIRSDDEQFLSSRPEELLELMGLIDEG